MVMEEQQSDMELDSERVPVPQVQQQQQQQQPQPQQRQKSENDEHAEAIVDKDTGSRNNNNHKPRSRKKALHAAILKQMEFYFSDANLRKDRYLSSLIKEEDPYVDLNVFLTFNKIKELTTDANRIAKALQGSRGTTILSLSEDGTKVRRVTPIVRRQKENIDDCTVYVQNLPPDADHETLKSTFSRYGTVVYVSIPKFKKNQNNNNNNNNQNRKIKGFAFIEFDEPESANKCLKAFRKKGRILPSYTAPEELLSITTFDEPEKDVAKGFAGSVNEEQIPRTDEKNKEEETNAGNTSEPKKSESEDQNQKKTTTTKKEEKRSKKRKRKDSTAEFSESPTTAEEKQRQQRDNESVRNEKRFKYTKNDEDEENEEQCEVEALPSTATVEDADNRASNDRTIASNEDDDDDTAPESEIARDKTMTTTTTKKKKRKKRKKRSKTEEIGDSGGRSSDHDMGLQAMAKRDWKQLRNKYLELQRNKMKQLKQHLRKTRWTTQWSNRGGGGGEQNKTSEVKQEQTQEEGEEKDENGKQDVATAPRRFSFTPGVIVKIETEKPCTDPKGLKTELRNKNGNSVKYVDVEDGSHVAYVRCDTNETAQALARKTNEAAAEEEEDEKQATILEGEEEKAYWNKILNDREEKLTRKVRPKQRGRNKLLKKAEKELGKHIKFDEV